MKFTLLLSALPLALASVIPRDTATVAAPAGAKLISITHGGTGCPQDAKLAYTAGQSLDQSIEATLTTAEFSVGAGSSYTIVDSRKNCQWNVALSVPAGYKYQVASSRYKGALNLATGTTAVQKATYYYAGETFQWESENEFSGPLKSHYWIEDVLPQSAPWSPCGRQANLNINSQVRVDNEANPKASGSATGSINNEISLSLDVRWAKC